MFHIPTYKIENVVASISLAKEFNLQELAMVMDGSTYEPEMFPGLIYRIKEPKTAFLIFRSGKVVCTGAKSVSHIKTAVKKVIDVLEKIDIDIIKDPEIVVQNVVASIDLGQPLNLNAIAISFGLERVEYEPEQFPGLVYRMFDPKVVLLLFGSGKIVCTGGKKPSDIEAAIRNIEEELRSAGQIR